MCDGKMRRLSLTPLSIFVLWRQPEYLLTAHNQIRPRPFMSFRRNNIIKCWRWMRDVPTECLPPHPWLHLPGHLHPRICFQCCQPRGSITQGDEVIITCYFYLSFLLSPSCFSLKNCNAFFPASKLYHNPHVPSDYFFTINNKTKIYSIQVKVVIQQKH